MNNEELLPSWWYERKGKTHKRERKFFPPHLNHHKFHIYRILFPICTTFMNIILKFTTKINLFHFAICELVWCVAKDVNLWLHWNYNKTWNIIIIVGKRNIGYLGRMGNCLRIFERFIKFEWIKKIFFDW
jgi:hypothetical protein